LIIQDSDKYTLMLGLQQFIANDYGNNWGVFAAGCVLGAIPQVAIFLFLQEQIVGGLTAGSVKG
jgi:arabinogalactan oligomer/maltooligosaccharide transport system permease protein